MQNENLSHVSLYMKLHRAKMSIGKVVKNATNPHFKRSYADINALLDTVEPILHENGLLLLQPIKDNILTTQIIDIDSGNFVESWLPLPSITDPQKMILNILAAVETVVLTGSSIKMLLVSIKYMFRQNVTQMV